MRLSVAIACVLLTAASVSANPPDIYGFGARAIGMGGAVTGAVDDTAATFYNPAALTRRPNIQIDTGYLLTDTSLRLNGKKGSLDEGGGFQLGVAVPGSIGPVKIAFGLGLHLPQHRLSRVRALPQIQPRWALYDNRPQRVFINVNLAVSPTPWLHLGAGVNFLTHTRGTVRLEGLVFVPEFERTTLPTEVDVNFTTIRYPSLGVMITPNEQWSLGITYREEVAVVLDLGATVSGSVILADTLKPGLFEVRSFNTNLYTPRQLWLGTAYRPISTLLLTADAGWLNWATYSPPTAAVDMTLDIDGIPTDSMLPPASAVIAPNFHDILSVRTGVEWTLNLSSTVDLALRSGYGFEPSPAPKQKGSTNYVDTDKHILAYGLGIKWHKWSPWVGPPLSIDLGGQATFFSERKYYKDSPADPIGDYTADGLLLTFCGTVKWQF